MHVSFNYCGIVSFLLDTIKQLHKFFFLPLADPLLCNIINVHVIILYTGNRKYGLELFAKSYGMALFAWLWMPEYFGIKKE